MSLPVIIKKKVSVLDPQGNPVLDEKTGRPQIAAKYYTNPAKSFVKPYWHTTDVETIALAGLGVSGRQTVTIDESMGHFEIAYLMSQQTGPYTIMIRDPGRGNYMWMNRPIHIDCLAGNAQRPFILPETYFLNVSGGARQLSVEMTDISGAANNARFVFAGRRFVYREAPLNIWQSFEEYYSGKERTNLFFLTTEQPITALVPGIANLQNFQFRITSDAFFEAIKFTYATFPPNINLDIRMWEYGSGRSFLPANQRTDINNMFGSAQFPFIPSESYFFERDYTINGDVVNTDVVNCDVYLTIIGRRIKFPEEVQK